MLKSTKGNLLCFQWEVERFQRSHRERMAAVAPQINSKPISLPRRRGGPRKTANIDVKLQNGNALHVEKTSRVHGAAGGCQRRSLQESQDAKTALPFGKASEALSRAANKRRLNLRKQNQERVRRENAKLFTRLASPNRSGIDFNKFEAEFSESRARHRMIHCDRTVGHTLVFSAVHARERCPRDEAATAICKRTRRRKQPPPRRKELSDAPETNAAPWARMSGRPQDQSAHARRLLSTRQPWSAWVSPRRPPGDIAIQGADGNGCRYDEAHYNNAVVVDNKGGEAGATACGAHFPGRYRQGSGTNRPRTASGLQGVRDHPDLFDARAADPGWGSTGVYSADRPLSAPERDSWRAWNKADTTCGRPTAPSQTFAISILPNLARTYHPRSATNNECRKANGVHKDGNASEDGSEYAGNKCFFGRTLLAEAKILVDGSAQTNHRCRTKVSLMCSSLDGLIRQQGRVRKTLQGFVVEALIAARPHSTSESADRVSSRSVSVSVVQDFLKTSARNFETSLAPFQEAPPLDDQGNYPELATLMGKAGQRDLYQTLLGSCRVVASVDGAIGVEFLQASMELGMSATVATGVVEHRARANRPNFPRPRRPVAAKRGEPLPTGTDDKRRRTGAVRGSGGESDKRQSGPKECHGDFAGSDGGASSASFYTSGTEEQGMEEPPVVAAQSSLARHTAREAAVEHDSEIEIYETLHVEDVEGEEKDDDDDEQGYESD